MISRRYFQMNRKVHLLGELSQFGEVWQAEAKSLSDIIKLIECQTEGFRKFLIDAVEAGLDLAIVGKDFFVSEPEELVFNNLGPEELYISLVPAGSGKGWGKILLAAVLIVVALSMPLVMGPQTGFGMFTAGAPGGMVFAQNALLMIGLSIGMQGVTQLLAKTPDADKPENEKGLFDGPESSIKQGQPVSVLYGELLIGGAPVHVDMTISTVGGPPSARSIEEAMEISGTEYIVLADGTMTLDPNKGNIQEFQRQLHAPGFISSSINPGF